MDTILAKPMKNSKKPSKGLANESNRDKFDARDDAESMVSD